MFPYIRGREWVNKSDGATTGDPVADAQWFEDVEEAIHRGEESAGGGLKAIASGLSTQWVGENDGYFHILPFDNVEHQYGSDILEYSNVPYGWYNLVGGLFVVHLHLTLEITGETDGNQTVVGIGMSGSSFDVTGTAPVQHPSGTWLKCAENIILQNTEDMVARVSETVTLALDPSTSVFAYVAAGQDVNVFAGRERARFESYYVGGFGG